MKPPSLLFSDPPVSLCLQTFLVHRAFIDFMDLVSMLTHRSACAFRHSSCTELLKTSWPWSQSTQGSYRANRSHGAKDAPCIMDRHDTNLHHVPTRKSQPSNLVRRTRDSHRDKVQDETQVSDLLPRNKKSFLFQCRLQPRIMSSRAET